MRFLVCYAFQIVKPFHNISIADYSNAGQAMQQEMGFEYVSLAGSDSQDDQYSGITFDLTLEEALLHPLAWVRQEALDRKDNWKMNWVVYDLKLANGEDEFEFNDAFLADFHR